MNNTTHFTNRRAFIATTGFGGVSLYGLWAAYGAAPGPLALLGLDGAHNEAYAQEALQPSDQPAASGGHGGHGAPAAGPDSEEFSRLTAEFSERYRMPDGSVYPRRLATAQNDHDNPHAGHDMQNMAMPADPHAKHSEAAVTTVGNPAIEVLMMAGKWYYLPNVLRLDAGQAYRFKMMALDVTHGASIQFGKGGRMMRLQPGQLSETELTFQNPGRYLMHCTVYCGAAHDMMQATIEVA
ncbi:MAG: cupredoxin domain-containing protein [Rhodoferax sp.]|nr:cupredoxin domain-containing protein [Rhodoferax sp.]